VQRYEIIVFLPEMSLLNEDITENQYGIMNLYRPEWLFL
jgi:hypothetical protein